MGSRSKYIEQNNTRIRFADENQNIIDGIMIAEDLVTILRFKDGYLDGDVFDDEGNLITVHPAVEGPGHIEYWRQNKLHRDNNEPAVISDGFTVREWWENGERIK